MVGERRARKVGGTGWNLWRGVVGVAYLVAAAANLFYTLPKDDLGWLADHTWFPFLSLFITEIVLPNNELFMVLVVAFELAVGLLILSRGWFVDLGIAASVLWVLFLIPFLQPLPEAATNVGLAIVQGMLLLRRYDRSIWGLLRRAATPMTRDG